MSILSEYKKSLKMAEAEEVLDLTLYRPVAFGFVNLVHRLPITPNQITALSLFAALIGGYCFSVGEATFYFAAAIWYLVANILDCADGMLARLQKSGSPLGRLIDGIVDYVSSVAIFLGLGIGLAAQTGDARLWYLVAAAGISSAVQAIFFDYHQQEYISNVRGEQNFLGKEIDNVEQQLASLQPQWTNWFRLWALGIYIRYMKFQQQSQFKEETKKQYSPDLYRSFNRTVMHYWTYLGTSTNRTILIICALLYNPILYLWLTLIPGNLYMFLMLIWQRSVQRRIDSTPTEHISASR